MQLSPEKLPRKLFIAFPDQFIAKFLLDPHAILSYPNSVLTDCYSLIQNKIQKIQENPSFVFSNSDLADFG